MKDCPDWLCKEAGEWPEDCQETCDNCEVIRTCSNCALYWHCYPQD